MHYKYGALFLPNIIYRFSAILIKIPTSYFVNIGKWILKFTWRGERSRIANTILKVNKVGGMILPASRFVVRLQ